MPLGFATKSRNSSAKCEKWAERAEWAEPTSQNVAIILSMVMKKAAAVVVAVLFVAVTGAVPLAASPSVTASPIGVYPSWTLTPADPTAQNHSGTIGFDVVGLSDASFTVQKSVADGEDTSLLTSDGAGEWMTTETPFGAVFGPSGPSSTVEFLQTRVDTQYFETISTTIFTFDSPTLAGTLGFAIGDIDLDQVVISATDATGAAVTGVELGGNVFNFCDVVIDRPSDCDGSSAPYALPTWDLASRTVSYPTLEDTDGAIAWFRPSTEISTLTFTFSGDLENSGSPSYRLWLAGLASSVGGQVTFPDGAAVIPVDVQLFAPDGSLIATAATNAIGSFSFAQVVAVPGYTIAVTAPNGFSVSGNSTEVLDLSLGSVTVNFSLESSRVLPSFTG